jgi:O-acetyl-ADP-ribose deacetylase (regulator of RNase III)
VRVTIFHGELADAPGEALWTSTNPRLSLAMGTGASVRERGGYQILRECERIIEEHGDPWLKPGTAWKTGAGTMKDRCVVHCVASDAGHHSSLAIVQSCVLEAARLSAGCRSIALPVLATGHAHVPFDESVKMICDTLKGTQFENVYLVVNDEERATQAAKIARAIFGSVTIDRSNEEDESDPWLYRA